MTQEQRQLPWLEQPLREALSAKREHHALLIHGPRGTGQFELALLLSRAWLCESERAERPCERCPACALTRVRNHPDALVLLPEALALQLAWVAGEDTSVDATARKPSKDIRVDAVRNAIDFAQATSARGRAKVVVIFPAERMNAIAANALLKTLEEPPGLARFVLATGDPQALPATVRSRCQALHLPAPPADVALRWLEGQGVKRPAGLLAAAGGQPFEALAWSKDGIDADVLARLPQAVLEGDASAFAPWPLPRAIELLQKICHDALLGKTGAMPRYFIDLPAMPRASIERLHRWADALARASRHAEHPWNAGLMVESLVLQGWGACQGMPAEERSRAVHSLHSTA